MADDSSRTFTVLLVNYKTPRLTPICLDLLKSHLDLTVAKVCVVDNDSRDESTEYLRSLDWIELLERRVSEAEEGHLAHARALDFAFRTVTTRHVLCMHTDTFVHDTMAIDLMFQHANSPDVAAVGSVDQVCRSLLRQWWRTGKSVVTYGARGVARRLRLSDRRAKPLFDRYLKSYFCLWNAELIRRHGLAFCMGDHNPGYAMQDALERFGYRCVRLPACRLFKSIDHVQAGTLVETGRLAGSHRRSREYARLLSRLDS